MGMTDAWTALGGDPNDPLMVKYDDERGLHFRGSALAGEVYPLPPELPIRHAAVFLMPSWENEVTMAIESHRGGWRLRTIAVSGRTQAVFAPEDLFTREVVAGQGQWMRQCAICGADDYAGPLEHLDGCAELREQAIELRRTA